LDIPGRIRIANRTVCLSFSDPYPAEHMGLLRLFSPPQEERQDTLRLSLETHLCPGSALPRVVASRWARTNISPARCADLIQVSDKGWMAVLMGPQSHCHLFAKKSKLGKALLGALSLFLRYRIPPEEGTCFHAAGVQIDGRAMLFIGPSGVGKTTLAAKAKRARLSVLCDEQIFVTWRRREGFVAHGTPFGRMSDGPLRAPVGAVFFLRQARELSLAPLGGARAAAMAWSDGFYGPHFVAQPGRPAILDNNLADASSRGRIFSRWLDLFCAVPCFDMGCPLDFDRWDLLARAAAPTPRARA
jgi:hypothetical protein